LVGLVVLNRVKSADFPNTVRDVIFQEGQFTPISNGRFDAVEPDDSCKAAVHLISTGWDESQGATYLSTHETDWHRERLTFLFEKGAHRFYK
ncbi:MAG TPA: cell wall hydrolase, partial [Ruminococcaceae bacterium]|nr:cell wall hydrolase [Oscillospiraceae bacterium]